MILRTSHKLQVQGRCCNLIKLTPSSMEAVSPLMTQGADKLCDNLSILAAKGKAVDIWRHFGQMVIDVVGTAAFG